MVAHLQSLRAPPMPQSASEDRGRSSAVQPSSQAADHQGGHARAQSEVQVQTVFAKTRAHRPPTTNFSRVKAPPPAWLENLRLEHERKKQAQLQPSQLPSQSQVQQQEPQFFNISTLPDAVPVALASPFRWPDPVGSAVPQIPSGAERLPVPKQLEYDAKSTSISSFAWTASSCSKAARCSKAPDVQCTVLLTASGGVQEPGAAAVAAAVPAAAAI